MNYIISEELREKLLECAGYFSEWSDIEEQLSAINPVQSSVALDALAKAREKVQAVINTRDIRQLINIEVSFEVIEKALQLAAPTLQPEARGVDKVAGIMYANSTDEADDGKWIEAKDYHKVAALILAHLQQSMQSDSAILGGSQIEEADRRIMERSFEQLERKDQQRVVGWIPVTERLPIFAGRYQVCWINTLGDQRIDVADFTNLPHYDGGPDAWRWFLSRLEIQPTYWQPLSTYPVKVDDHE